MANWDSYPATGVTPLAGTPARPGTVLDEILNVQMLLDEIRNAKDKESKMESWEKLKIRLFTRIIAEIYALGLFVSYLRVQLSVIAGYVYLDSCKNGSLKANINQNIQKQYLSLLNTFYQEGIAEIIDPVQEAVETAIGDLSLKEKIALKDVKSIFEKVKNVTINTHVFLHIPMYSSCIWCLVSCFH